MILVPGSILIAQDQQVYITGFIVDSDAAFEKRASYGAIQMIQYGIDILSKELGKEKQKIED